MRELNHEGRALEERRWSFVSLSDGRFTPIARRSRVGIPRFARNDTESLMI
jgi:hypothetical protein